MQSKMKGIKLREGLLLLHFFQGKGTPFFRGRYRTMAMGVDVKNFRRWMFVVCAIIVASLVSVTGIIGFVGLMVPHIVRLLSGTSNNKVIIPLSAIFGATYLIWADAAARGLFGAAELLLGIITAFVGAPFFFYLMAAKSRGGNGRGA